MLVSLEECLPHLRCPGGNGRLVALEERWIWFEKDGGRERFPVLRGKPILVDFATSVLAEDDVVADRAEPIARKTYRGAGKIVKRLLSPKKASTRQNIAQLEELLAARKDAALVLIIGGGSIGQGMDPIYASPRTKIFAFDIYYSDSIQFLADAHKIPLPSDFFDAVIIQAVLEHVLQPSEVVSEIWRVLKPGGLVYAETPFMQQVHEAAYDFTRFTESGHRYLFRRFEVISSGASGGPGLQFMWSIDYLFRSLFRSVTAGKIAKAAFFWTQYLDNMIPQRYAVDAASGVFFLGRKSDAEVSQKSIIAHYKGAQ